MPPNMWFGFRGHDACWVDVFRSDFSIIVERCTAFYGKGPLKPKLPDELPETTRAFYDHIADRLDVIPVSGANELLII